MLLLILRQSARLAALTPQQHQCHDIEQRKISQLATFRATLPSISWTASRNKGKQVRQTEVETQLACVRLRVLLHSNVNEGPLSQRGSAM